MIRLWLALFAVLALPQQGAAFSMMQREGCVAAWNIINKSHETRVLLFKSPRDGWCQLPRFLPAAEAVIKGLDFDRIEWRAEGLERVLEQSLPPTALTIRVTDAAMLQKLGRRGDLDLPAIPMQIVLTLRENAKDRQLLIEALTITGPKETGPKENLATLQGVFHDVDLSSLESTQLSLGNAKLRDVIIVAPGNRKLESYLRRYIGVTFPERSRKRIAMMDRVSGWPDHSFPRATKRAVQQLIASLPAPSGVLRVKVETGAGLSVGLFVQTVLVGGSLKELGARILDSTVFHATWTAR